MQNEQEPLHDETTPTTAVDTLAQLLGLWILTLIWLWLGGCLALVLTDKLAQLLDVRPALLSPTGGLGAASLLLSWVLLLRWGLPHQLPVQSQVVVYPGFAVSQLATCWWLLEHSFEGFFTNYPN